MLTLCRGLASVVCVRVGVCKYRYLKALDSYDAEGGTHFQALSNALYWGQW